ncbi:hypothetical protein [Flagellimonas sp. 2504JD4-2]
MSASLFSFLAFRDLNRIINDDDYLHQKYFVVRKWNGIVVEKYIDTLNYNYLTIEIVNGIDTIKVQEKIIQDFENYDQIDVGDSIVKQSGEQVVHLFKKSGAVILESDPQ